MNETDTMTPELYLETEVIETKPLGYGNPEAAISYVKQKESGELPADVEAAMVEAIMSGECLVEITEPDDGCIDGRTVARITYADASGAIHETEATPDDVHERYKLAGGGYMTALAMEFALNPPMGGIDEALKQVVTKLAEQDIYCGAHSGDHKKPEQHSTDCGANDKFETILENGLVYRDDIAKTADELLSVAGVEYSSKAQAEVADSWAHTLQLQSSFEKSTGESRYDTILGALKEAQAIEGDEKPLAVLKHLQGDHKEDFIVINLRAGHTFSQAKLRGEMREHFPDLPEYQLPQAFIVDVPRIVQLAEAVSNDAGNKDENEADPFGTALQAGVSYQLATAATLTDGSLRVFIIK